MLRTGVGLRNMKFLASLKCFFVIVVSHEDHMKPVLLQRVFSNGADSPNQGFLELKALVSFP